MFTLEEAAQRMGISVNTLVIRLKRMGLIPRYNAERKRLLTEDEIGRIQYNS